MRLWMIPPHLLCRKHLLAEHGEIHKHLPSFRKGHSVHGRFFPEVQIQLTGLTERHDALAEEMLHRGFRHASPLENTDWLLDVYPDYFYIEVNPFTSRRVLCDRCPDCAERIVEEEMINGLCLS